MTTLVDSSHAAPALDSAPAVPSAAERDANRIRFETELEVRSVEAVARGLQSPLVHRR